MPLTDLGERLELRTQDARFTERGPRSTSARIVLVTLDAETQSAWPEPMVFWGGHYGQLIRQARKDGVRCVGLDVIPAINADEALQSLVARSAEGAAPSGDGPGLDGIFTAPEMNPDRELTDAIRAAGNVVILDSRRGGTLLAPEVRDQISAGSIAFVDPPVQKDDAVRAAPLEVTGASLAAPGFPSLVAAFPDSLLSRRAWPNQNRIQTASAQGVTLSYFWINYTRIRGPEPAFLRIPACRLAADELTAAERQALKQAIVLVGNAAEQGEDWHHIPGGQAEEGVAIQAQAVATLLDHQALGRSSPVGEAWITLCFLALLLPFLIRLPATTGLASTLGAGVFWWMLGSQLFARGPWLLPMAAPLTGLGAVFLVYHAARSVEEALARRHVERAFGHNVTPAIRDYLLASPQHLRLGGEETEASVLFFDLRGSTQFAESRSPHAVVTELNSLYEVIVPLIERREGLLYRFLGDGFLAVFGAPRPLPDHARAACLAAMDIMQCLEGLNTTRRTAGLEIWRAGCGVHTGRLVYGNLGAASRAEFTVIGNTVNLAARLEGLNKEMNSQIIISEAAYLQAGDLPVVGPSERWIAGRQEPIRIYILQTTAERSPL